MRASSCTGGGIAVLRSPGSCETAGGTRRRIELAYSLQLSMPGTPVIRYGEEIGMGDNLDLPERDAIRTPMQWDGTKGAGFSRADPARFVAPLVEEGPHAYKLVNVTSQRLDPN